MEPPKRIHRYYPRAEFGQYFAKAHAAATKGGSKGKLPEHIVNIMFPELDYYNVGDVVKWNCVVTRTSSFLCGKGLISQVISYEDKRNEKTKHSLEVVAIMRDAPTVEENIETLLERIAGMESHLAEVQNGNVPMVDPETFEAYELCSPEWYARREAILLNVAARLAVYRAELEAEKSKLPPEA